MIFSHRALVEILSFFSFDVRNTKLKSNAQPRPSKKNVEWNDPLLLSASQGEITSSSGSHKHDSSNSMRISQKIHAG